MKKIENIKKISDINKLILFNFSQLINSILFWILFSIFLISQPLIICIIHFASSLSLLNYSLLII
ncbi:MAG: hypothetical protein K2I49_03280, partial [Ureaplasma sp.]|nr:hypothetical protein [Ureaplasma sp.]